MPASPEITPRQTQALRDDKTVPFSDVPRMPPHEAARAPARWAKQVLSTTHCWVRLRVQSPLLPRGA